MKVDGVSIVGPVFNSYHQILTPEALTFTAKLARNFERKRQELLGERDVRQCEIDNGKMPNFLPDSYGLRESEWRVGSIPKDLERRFVEITGPVERKMIINALNSGANVFMADFEDSNSPTWQNNIEGQINLRDAVDKTITYTSPEGKKYELKKDIATLMVRPRGLHLDEEHVLVDGKPISASIFDFALYFYHNANKLIENGTGPYFYLPKLEGRKEARLWNEIFEFAQNETDIPQGTIKATVLIETILAAFEMNEILFELWKHSGGLNAGVWDYLFSIIKKFFKNAGFVMGDRSELTMDKPPIHPYTELLVKTCHERGIHAMGGMSALIPIKGDPEANQRAIEKIIRDKEMEAKQGFDGAWVAHPGLVPIVREIFEKHMNGRPNQIENKREDVKVTAKDLLTITTGNITEAGVRTNVRATILYLAPWLCSTGCVALDNKMEDAATVEISRSQLGQWIEHKAKLADGRAVIIELVKQVIKEELAKIKGSMTESEFKSGKYELAAKLLERVLNKREFTQFITLEAYPHIKTVVSEPKVETKEEFVQRVSEEWKNPRWEGIVRPYTAEDVYKLRGTVDKEFSVAKSGANKLWNSLHEDEPVRVLSAVTGNQAIEEVQAGLRGVYVSGWQVAGDMNNSLQMYPDQSLYTSDSVPTLVKRINNSLMRADQITHLEGDHKIDWMVPLVADAEAGFGDKLHSFEIMKQMIEAGASGVHFEDQLASVKKCGHLGGKVVVPTKEFIDKLVAARLACDVSGVDTLIIARTDAGSGSLLTSDIDENDKPFIIRDEDNKPKRTSEGFYMVKAGLEQAISRGLAYAPYSDLLWMETSTPDLEEARKFAQAIHAKFPGKLLAYNCSPSFNWKAKLDEKTIANFQKELGKMGYKFQFVTLSGFHALNHSMFELAREYKNEGMAAYSRLQQAEFRSEKDGYTATKHQRFVGTGYFDAVTLAASRGQSSTTAMKGSTEEAQFTNKGKK